MKDTWLIYPMFAMVLLTFSTLVRLFRARVALVKEGKIEVSYYRIYQGAAEPERSAKLSRHFINQFESPLLFYAACLAAIAVHATSMTLLVLAWLFVVARAIHAYIHTGSNRLRQRIRAYMASWAVLLLLWAALVIRIAG